ncbi:MAG: efflux RND transporter periplasmic adaptor subunit [Patescibacteria group bacterium]|nr:efflux RND transporter periplasmic adaptor subunit [Patescibacteria group bacterium]
MKKSKHRFFKSKWFWIVIIIILALVGYVWIKRSNAKPTFQSASVSVGDVIQQVSVTGTVSPDKQTNLAFEKGGTVSKIYVKVGDTVKAGTPVASLDSSADQASVDSAKATLADMSRSLTPDELAVQTSNVSAAKTALDNARQTAVNAFHTAYVQAQGSIVNYADAFFNNPQSANPTINVRTESATQQLSINNERVSISGVLNSWSDGLSAASTSAAAGLMGDANGYLDSVKSFMTDLSSIVNALSPGNSGLSQSAIDADVAAMNSGRSALNTAISTITTAQTGLTSAQSAYDQAVSNYNLKLAGNSTDSIAAQAAKVAQAQAILAQDTLVAPIDGVVTLVSPQVGDYVGAGQTEFTVQGSQFKIEAYVPEADIAKVKIGDLASSTLDAYGAFVDFPAVVTAIDPAETILEGVPTYKVTLHFVSPDSRIRSGMTDNLEILTAEASGVLTVPYRAVAVTATSSSVNVVKADGKTYSAVIVTTGLKGSDGNIEITSGLQAGDKVVTYIPGQ